MAETQDHSNEELMAIQIQMRRGLASEWTSDNPTMASGEIGLETDSRMTKMGDGATAWNDLEYWPASGSEGRIYYDTLNQGMNGYPESVSTVNRANASAAPRIIQHWNDQFAYCFWEIHNFDTGATTIHTLPTVSAYVDWKNANLPHGGSPDTFERISVRPFDIVDGTIPTIDRMYGFPNMYAGMKGGRIKAGFNHFGVGQRGDAMFRQTWEHFFPFTIGLISDSDFATNAGGRKSCWTSSNATRLYAMPKVGEIISVGSTSVHPSYRHSASENWEGFNPLNPSVGYLKIVDRVILLLDESGNLDEILQYTTGVAGRKIRKHLLEYGNRSALVAFKLMDESHGPGDRQIAVLFKPVGIEKIWLPYFDSALYDMEMVYLNSMEAQLNYFKMLPWSSFNVGSGSSPHPNSGMSLRKTEFLPGTSRLTFGLSHFKYQNKYRIHFRLRDKVTRKVGEMSQSCIELKVGETNAPVKLVVSRWG